MVIKKSKLRKIEDEVWREVPNSNKRYMVSNYGRIKSYAYDKKDGKLLKCSEIKGFNLVQLNIDKRNRKFYVHKLVADMDTET